jgi:U3 small nucleolar RNA-associated protein 15
MSIPVKPLQPVKLPPGPSPLTPEQTYWKSFKSQQLVPSPSNSPINYISFPVLPIGSLTQPSDHFVVTTGARVQIFSVRSRKLIKTISRFDGIAHGAEIRRDGRIMVAGDDSGAIQVFDVNSRAILKTWKEHKQPVWATKFSPMELTTLLSASDDQSVRLWDLPSQESTVTFSGHQDYVRTVAFMPGQASGLVISGSYDQTVKLWDPRVATSAVMTFKHSAPVEAVLPMPTGTTVLAAADNRVSVLDIVAGRPLNILQNHQKTVTSLALASNDTRLVSGGLDGHVKIFETTGWNVVAGSKYSSPILALSVVSTGSGREDRHLIVGLQSGILSIKTRLSGQQKVKEREREKEMEALREGKIAEFDKKRAKKMPSGIRKRLRGRDFTGEGADVIIAGNDRERRKKLKAWEQLLRSGKYADALDKVLEGTTPVDQMTLLVALRHRSATRTALIGRDEVTLQPILRWIVKYITDPQYVSLCVDIGALILDIYAVQMGNSKDIDTLMRRLHRRVRSEVERSQQAWQTQGMLGLLLDA